MTRLPELRTNGVPLDWHRTPHMKLPHSRGKTSDCRRSLIRCCVFILCITLTRAQTSAPFASTPQPSTRKPSTQKPSQLPSDFPSLAPTLLPTPAPSDKPSVVPSKRPTRRPSDSPSDSPSARPTPRPSTPPPTTITNSPTKSASPSAKPTPKPTKPPVTGPTDNPTAFPTTTSPTGTPTSSPSLPQQRDAETINIVLYNMRGPMNSTIQIEFAVVTEKFMESSIKGFGLNPPVYDLRVDAKVESQTAKNVRRRRRQQQRDLQSSGANYGPLTVVVQMQVEYRSVSTDYTLSDWISEAFNSPEDEQNYINALRSSQSNAAFWQLSDVEVVVDGSSVPVEDGDTTSTDKQKWTIIGASIGGGVALIALLVVLFRGKCSKSPGGKKNDQSQAPTDAMTSNKPAVLSTDIFVDRQDDVSTLGDPFIGTTMGMGSALQDRDENTASVSDDYDYARNYLLQRDPSSTSTRDRFNSSDSGPGMTRESSSGSKLGPVADSVFSDDASFEKLYEHQPPSNESKDFRFEILVPAGKLGMVIDTPNGGVPVVHAVKSDSVLADKVQVGDRLVRVDDEDVTSMTAIQVSKLISIKADQERLLVFVRSQKL